MTALNVDAIQPDPQQQSQEEATLSQAKVETNLTQKNEENPEQKDDSEGDPNWRAFREARKRDRIEKEAAERRAIEKEQEVAALKAAMEAAFTKGSAPTPQAYQQYYGMNQGFDQPEETEEQRIERKVNEMLTKKEREYVKQQAEMEAKVWPDRLKKDIPDVWKVCSQENLDYLDYHYPEISRPLQRLSEGYDKWHDTYHAVKKLIPNHSTAKKEAVRADMNSQKPRSISSSGPSHTGEKTRETWQDTEARRAENWARMQKMLRGVGS
jgi:hypothetical protein